MQGKSTCANFFKAHGVPVLDSDNEALRRLEGVVHPLVTQEKARFLADMARQHHRLVVVDVPLLYETGAQAQCDAVAVVSAPAEVQRQRVLARPGMTEEKLAAILARQMPDAEKRQKADFVIDTGVSLGETEAHVTALIDALRGRRGTAFQRIMGEARQQPDEEGRQQREGQTAQQQEQGTT
ncbi:hypothetical protein N2152v2_001998 [Parachlorella kessleri]